MKRKRKRIAQIIILAMLLSLFPIVPTSAASKTVTLDGQAVTSTNFAPITENKLVYVPLKELSQLFKGTYLLDAKSGKVFMQIGDTIANVSTTAKKMEVNTLSTPLKYSLVNKSNNFYMEVSDLENAFQIQTVSSSDLTKIDLISPNQSAYIIDLKGTVEVLAPRAELYAWKAATTKSNLISKSSIRTGESSKAELRFGDGSTILLGANTTLLLTNISFNPATKQRMVDLTLVEGETWSNVVKQLNNSKFTLTKGDYKLTAIGTQVYSGPDNIAVLSGTVTSENKGEINAIPTGTGALYGLEPVMLEKDNAYWKDQYVWANQKLEDSGLQTTGAELAMIQMTQILPKTAPEFASLATAINQMQEKVVWNQFEIRQSAPMSGKFPNENILEDFMAKQQVIQDFVLNEGKFTNTVRDNLLKQQQVLMDQYQQNLGVATTQKLMDPKSLAKLDLMSNNAEALIPKNIVPDQAMIPQVPMPSGVAFPKIGIPENMILPDGMVIPPGFEPAFFARLPQNSMLPPKFELPQGGTLPVGTILPSDVKLPDNFVLPTGAVLPLKFNLGSMKLPDGVVLPKGLELPLNTVLPTNVDLPPGFTFRADMKLPDFKNFELPPGFTAPKGFIPDAYVKQAQASPLQTPASQFKDTTGKIIFTVPQGFTPPKDWKPPTNWNPANALPGEVPPGWVKAPDFAQNITNSMGTIKEFNANGGVVLPEGFKPPDGFVPPVGWKAPTEFKPTENALPPGWELMPKDFAVNNPALNQDYNQAVDNIFKGSLQMPKDFNIPQGIKPSDNFKPPEGWQPPEGWKPPQEFVPPTTWNLPKEWTPPAGFAPPKGMGENPGGMTPPAGFDPSKLMPNVGTVPPGGTQPGMNQPPGEIHPSITPEPKPPGMTPPPEGNKPPMPEPSVLKPEPPAPKPEPSDHEPPSRPEPPPMPEPPGPRPPMGP